MTYLRYCICVLNSIDLTPTEDCKNCGGIGYREASDKEIKFFQKTKVWEPK